MDTDILRKITDPEKLTRDELFAEVKSLENQTFALISDDARQEEFDLLIAQTQKLTGIAMRKGWL